MLTYLNGKEYWLLFQNNVCEYVFALQIDHMLLSMFCTWFVTLWKSSFPRNPPYPSEITALEPPLPLKLSKGLPWGGWGYFLEPHIVVKIINYLQTSQFFTSAGNKRYLYRFWFIRNLQQFLALTVVIFLSGLFFHSLFFIAQTFGCLSLRNISSIYYFYLVYYFKEAK